MTRALLTPSRQRRIVALALALGVLVGAAAVLLWRHAGDSPPVPAQGNAAIGPAAPALPATGPAAQRKVLYWYDPMKPDQKFDRPGKSPFMDMQLVPKYAEEAIDAAAPAAGADPGAGSAATGSPAMPATPAPGSTLSIDPRVVNGLGVRTVTVALERTGAALDVAATVTLNERDVTIVQTRVGGFVERVYGRAPGDVVAAGSPLADLLVPEWAGAQQEYLAVRAVGDAALTRAARQRLLLLGMTEAQVARVESTGTVAAVTTITTPAGGLVQELMVRAGMTLAPGMTLARINGLGTVWLEAALPESQAAAVAPGQPAQARFAALPGEVFRGKVAAVLPEANRDSRTLRVRIELPNPGGRLKSGMFAQVAISGPARDALVVPAEAVIRTGRRALVYVVDAPGRFRPVQVELGADLGDRLVITQGLAVGQQVVSSGQFLIDSEASLQGVSGRDGSAPQGAMAPRDGTAAPDGMPQPSAGSPR